MQIGSTEIQVYTAVVKLQNQSKGNAFPSLPLSPPPLTLPIPPPPSPLPFPPLLPLEVGPVKSI